MPNYKWIGPSAAFSNATSWLPDGPPSVNDSVTIDTTGVVVSVPISANFVIGDNGSGSLFMSNAAELLLQPSTQLLVGTNAGGNGFLSIAAGAHVIDQDGTAGDIIGLNAGAVGTVSVDGAGSAWSTSGRIFVGNDGTGSLLISNGGVVSATGLGSSSNLSIYVGAASDGTGQISVTGAGSALTATGRIGSGVGGTGEIDVLNGATVSTSVAPTLGRSSVFAGGSAGANGTIVVSGAGSRLDSGGGPIGISVGPTQPSSSTLRETGTLEVLSGGTVVGGTSSPASQFGLDVGDQSPTDAIISTGSVIIDGVGSSLSVTGAAGIGSWGSGVLQVSNSATASLGRNPGTVDGGTYFGYASAIASGQGTIETGGSLASYGQLVIGNLGSANIIVRSGGQMSSFVTSADIAAGQNGITVAASGTASLTVTDSGSRVSTNSLLSIGRGGLGVVNVANGATVTTTGAMRLGWGTSWRGNGSALVDGANSVLSVRSMVAGADASGTLSVGVSNVGIANGGTLLVGTQLTLGGTSVVSIDSTSAIEIGGTGSAVAGVVNIDLGGQLAGHGDVNGAVRAAGSVDVFGGVLRLSGAASGTGSFGIEASGTLQLDAATGNVANVIFNGAGTLRLLAPTGFFGVITLPAFGGTIDIVGNTNATAEVVGSNLHITGDGGSYNLALGSGYSGLSITSSADAGTGVLAGTNLVIACFGAGTHIATARGDVQVDHLQVGDLVVSHFGGFVPIIWLGYRQVDCRHHPRPLAVWPVRVASGAFGMGLPRRDLLLSPDHAVYADGVLIPIRCLLNGTTIRQVACARIKYFHVELPQHDVVLAEGLPAESYLDTGNRHAFANGGVVTAIDPDFGQRVWEAEACASQITHGPRLETVAARIRHEAKAAYCLGVRQAG